MLARRKGESKRFRACGCGPAEARALIRTYFVLNRALTAQGSAPVSAQPKDSSFAGEGDCGPQISLVARARTAETPVPQNGFGCYFWVFSVPPRLRGGCLFFGCDAESCPDSTGKSACATKWLWLLLLGFLRASVVDISFLVAAPSPVPTAQAGVPVPQKSKKHRARSQARAACGPHHRKNF